MRKTGVIIWLLFLFLGISAFFWYNEWVYRLPTPVPENYIPVATGEDIRLALKLKKDSSKPVFLHFFNPGCPCSRFNLTHFKTLVKEYSNEVNFVMVVMSDKDYTVNQIQDKFDINIPVLFDTTIAISCGVYSTPQAVIINRDHKFYYRGNYNRTRYCTERKTEYARLALDALLNHGPDIAFDRFALKAYGCQIPKCDKQ